MVAQRHQDYRQGCADKCGLGAGDLDPILYLTLRRGVYP